MVLHYFMHCHSIHHRMTKQTLQKLIAEGKTKQAIEHLLTLRESLPDSDLRQQILMLSGRFEQYNKDRNLDLSSTEEQSHSIAKINKALLDLIDKLPGEAATKAQATPVPEQATAKKNLWTYITGMALVIGLLGSLAEILNFINIIPSNSSEPFQLTIYVHGPGGLQDYVLENDGELLVDLGGDRRFAKIGEKGRTVFNEVPARFQGQTVAIAVKADNFVPVDADKQYSLEGKAIYYEVQKDPKLGLVKGTVKTSVGASLLPGVLVMIENEFTTTSDSLGRFLFEVPTEQIKEKYAVSFQKEGYKTLSEFYYPGTSQEFRMEKQ